ncbi:hypothetical protein B0H17DRAFT_1093329 [Mycena rosella]|uniref:DUF6533 domain-containing protein n=1 Tax=Mycena rosella TaxID=1033263 RepID=A0AAD7CUE5_MYCRO|nr:hypothetical protein B0H17DRAFT_1093329 [Mycena rosella]
MDALTSDDLLFAHDRRLNTSLSLAGLVVLVYDYFLTLEMEVKYTWARGNNKRGSAWFFFLRYFAFAGNIALAFMEFGDFKPEVRCICKHLKSAVGLLIVVQEFVIGCTLILRVYAMYSFNKHILWLLVVAAAVTVGLGAWSVVPAGPTPIIPISLPGCQILHSTAQSIRMAAAWEAELACNVLILGLTMYRAWQQTRDGLLPDGSLWTIMMRDGAMYFAVICLVNLANILMFYLGDVNMNASLAWFTAMISVVMITRLTLNLRAVASVDIVSDGDAPPHTALGTLRFATSTAGAQEESRW